MNQSFTRESRLLTQRDFSYVFDKAQKTTGKNLLVLYRLNNLGHARLGVILSKKNIKKAHDRNKVRRVARESFRAIKGTLPDMDIILLARRGLGDLDKFEIRKNFDKQWQKLSQND